MSILSLKSIGLRRLLTNIVDTTFFWKKNLVSFNNSSNSIKFVIWICEVGSRDFLGRFSEAVRLFENYKIPSLIVHKHSITRIPREILENSIVIDKSATYQCRHRLRFARLSGAKVWLLPEELIAVSSDAVIPAAIHPITSSYLDYIITSNKNLQSYSSSINLNTICCDNPRLDSKNILSTSKKYNLFSSSYDSITPFILINDSTVLGHSSFDNEEKLIHELMKGTGINSSIFLQDAEDYEIKNKHYIQLLIKSVLSREEFEHLNILIRPHPGSDIDKFSQSHQSILSLSNRIVVSREGSALEAMSQASLIFHYNCTTGIEACRLGLTNVFNIADELRPGVSNLAQNYTPPLGIKSSLSKAVKYLSNPPSTDSSVLDNYMSISSAIGSYHLPMRINNDILNDLTDRLSSELILSDSALDRWSSALVYIEKLSNVRSSHSPIRVFANIGVMVGGSSCS